MLENAWKGLNCTAFAYGQTGSGKSYSFFGKAGENGKLGNPGIVPMAADEIFKRIANTKDPNVTFQTTIQIIEIYMEKIHDLLVDPSKRGAPLEIRQNVASTSV